MKKAMILLLMALPFVITSCSDDDEYEYTKEILGTWKLDKTQAVEVKTNNQALTDTITKAINKLSQNELKIVFAADGKVLNGNGETGKYTIKGNRITVNFNDELDTLTFSIKGNKLTMYADETEYYRKYMIEYIEDTTGVTISKVTAAYSYTKITKN